MDNSDLSNLLHFLSEPRSLSEVAEHFNIATSVANYYLKKAIEQNQVLICRILANADWKSKKKPKQRETPFYISQDSHLLSKGLTGFVITRVAGVHGMTNGTASVKFNSDRASRVSSPLSRDVHAEIDGKSVFFPKTGVRKAELVRGARRKRFVVRRSMQEKQTKRLSAAEELSLFKALFCQPLSFLDLHTRFNVSKHTIQSFLKKGLLKKSWGPKNIGVRFRLTIKGKRHLKRLEASAKLEKNEIRKINVRFKHRSR